METNPVSPDPGPVGRRGHARLRLQLPARFETLDGKIQCWLQNVSCSGASLEMNSVPAIGKVGMLECEGMELFCEVVWARREFCGVTFDEPLDDARILQIRHIAANYCDIERQRHAGSVRDWVEGRA